MTKVNIVDPKKCESTICRSGGTNTDESKLDKRLAAGKLCFCYECLEELNAGRMALGCAPYEARD